jgi:hypothetical protein
MTPKKMWLAGRAHRVFVSSFNEAETGATAPRARTSAGITTATVNATGRRPPASGPAQHPKTQTYQLIVDRTALCNPTMR